MAMYKVGYGSYEDSHYDFYEGPWYDTDVLQKFILESAVDAYKSLDDEAKEFCTQLGDVIRGPAFEREMAKHGLTIIKPRDEISVFGWHGLGDIPSTLVEEDESEFERRMRNPSYWDQCDSDFDRRLFDAILEVRFPDGIPPDEDEEDDEDDE